MPGIYIQVDLIDMRTCRDRDYQWIGHYKDHFSKFSIIWPQKNKCAKETIECIERFVFAYLGVPKLLQSDNGKEFNNHVSENPNYCMCMELRILYLHAYICDCLRENRLSLHQEVIVN